MSDKVIGRFIADSAIGSAHLSSGAKQSVLQSQLMAHRRGVTGFSPANATSDDVSTEVLAVATTDTPRTDLTTGKGIYTGSVAGAGSVVKALVRDSGTDNGIDDGNSDEVYAVLTEAAGVYTLTYKKSDGTDFTMAGTETIDFYFVEISDLDDIPESSLLYQSVSGVVDAGSATTLAGHLDGGSNKHDASEIEVEGSYNIISTATVELALGELDTSLSGHLDGNTGKHDATEIDLELLDGSKKVIQASSDAVEAAIVDLDSALGDVITLSGVAQASTHLGEFTGTTIDDNQTIKQALQALETQVETNAGGISTNAGNISTNTGNISTNTGNISTNATAIGNLQTLSGVAANATHLGTFTGSTIDDSQTNKQALQALETAVETKTSELSKYEKLTLSAGDITNKYVDLALIPKTATAVYMCPAGGIPQTYGASFAIITDGSDIKRLIWDSGDAGVSVGMESDLQTGDILHVRYEVA